MVIPATSLQREGAPNILEKVVHQYFNYTPLLLASVREAAGKGDASALQKAAHSLKSSSANVGAVRLAELCKEVEVKARANVVHNAHERAAAIATEYGRVRAALEQELQRRIG